MTQKVIVIAEAGVNHNGDVSLAKRLIDVASGAGADFVKFQTFKADKLTTVKAGKAAYQLANEPAEDDSQYKMLKKLELSEADHRMLAEYCVGKKVGFLSTGFDEESVDFLVELGVALLKVPSGEVTNLPYLEHVGGKGKPVVLSTGMATMEEVKTAVDVLRKSGVDNDDLTVLHCTTDYPAQLQDVNLRAMIAMKEQLGVRVGYSDHTLGIEVPIAAVALGAEIIEKHFTLSRDMAGPDHKASLEPNELIDMVSAIRNVQVALSGHGRKEPSAIEKKNTTAARRSIHLAVAVKPGETLTRAHLIMKRPGDGISPMEVGRVIGMKVKQALESDTKVLWSNLEK